MSERLNTTDIARRINMNKSALVRYLALPENRAVFGAAQRPPTYPIEHIPMFEKLKVLHESGAITPQTFAGTWAMLSNISISEMPKLENRKGVLIPSAGDGAATLERIDDKMGQLVALATVAAQERLLTTLEASAYLSCAPERVSRYVRPVAGRRGKYWLSEVQAYLRELKAKNG
jgi:hypothetical protein